MNISDGSHTEVNLKRSLGLIHLIALGIGSVVGAGIFVFTGQAAATLAGPGVVVSFAIAGTGCFFAGLCYSEFAGLIPGAGSAYTYTYATMGRLMGWIIGWNLVLEYLAAASAVAVGWSAYFNDMLLGIGVQIPEALRDAPFALHGAHTIVMTGAVINLPAVFLVGVITAILVVGVSATANFNAAMVAIKVSIVLVVIFVCFSHIVPANHHPFIPANKGAFGEFGWSGVFRATGILFFAYIGFDAVCVAAQEAKNPQRDIPLGIMGALVICTLLYMLMSYVLTGIAPYQTLNVAHPVSKAVAALPATAWLTQFINVGAVVGLASVVLVMLLGQTRIFYAMGQDGLIPATFHAVHPRFRTPHKGTIITGSFCALLAGFTPLDILGQLGSIGTLSAFATVSVGVLILRIKAPHMKRPFKAPLVWITAPLGAIMCVLIMLSLPIDTWVRLLVWSALGLGIYFLYSIKHAKPKRNLLRSET